MEPKPWYKSKTVWTNIVAIASGIGAIMTGEVELAAGIGPIVLAAVNIVLRIVTRQPIGG